MAEFESPPVNPSSTQGRVASFLSEMTHTLCRQAMENHITTPFYQRLASTKSHDHGEIPPQATAAMSIMDSMDKGKDYEQQYGTKDSLDEMLKRLPARQQLK